MTSSCAISRWGPEGARCKHHGASMASENPVGLGNGIFGAHGIGTHVVGPLQDSLTGQFMLEKRAFWAQNQDFPLKFWDFLRKSLEIQRISEEISVLSPKPSLFVQKWTNRATDPLRGSQCHVPQKVPFPSPTGFSEAMEAP